MLQEFILIPSTAPYVLLPLSAKPIHTGCLSILEQLFWIPEA